MAFNFDAVLERKKERERKKDASDDTKKAIPKALFEQFENAADAENSGGVAKDKDSEKQATDQTPPENESGSDLKSESDSAQQIAKEQESGDEDSIGEEEEKPRSRLRSPAAERTDILYVTLNEDDVIPWAPTGVLPPTEKPPRAVQYPLPIAGVVVAPTTKPPRDFTLKSRSIVEYPPIGVRAPVANPPKRAKTTSQNVMGALTNMANAAMGNNEGVGGGSSDDDDDEDDEFSANAVKVEVEIHALMDAVDALEVHEPDHEGHVIGGMLIGKRTTLNRLKHTFEEKEKKYDKCCEEYDKKASDPYLVRRSQLVPLADARNFAEKQLQEAEDALFRFHFGDDGADLLAVPLSAHRNLEVLDLRDNDIGENGAAALARALLSNTFLKELYLNHNRIGPVGAEHISKALSRNDQNQLEILELHDCAIGDKGAEAVSTSLMSSALNPLHELNLRYNGIGDDGACALARALTSNASLIRLDLGTNSLGVAAAKAFAALLKGEGGPGENTTLQHVDLTHCDLDRLMMKNYSLMLGLRRRQIKGIWGKKAEKGIVDDEEEDNEDGEEVGMSTAMPSPRRGAHKKGHHQQRHIGSPRRKGRGMERVHHSHR